MLEFMKIVIGAKFDRKEDGATAVEYGLLVALIAAVIILVVGFLGQDVLEAFNVIEDNLGGNDA